MGNWRYSNTRLFTQLGLVTVVAVLIGGFAITPGYGQANQITSIVRVPFSSGGTPLCGGEEVQFSGIINLVSHVTLGPDGRFQYFADHLTFQGTGVTASGVKVVLTEADATVFNVRQISATEFQGEAHAKLIVQGKAINTVVEVVLNFIINANGQVTANVQHIDLKCVG